MITHFYSVYGPIMREFIDLKRSLGYKYVDVEYVLARFDRFMEERNEVSIGISKSIAEAWCFKSPNEASKSWYNRIQIIRSFAIYLGDRGYASYIPLLPPMRSTFVPYIFSKEEISRFFAACDELQPTRNHLGSRVFMVPCLFRLMYGTGLRVSEVMQLKCGNVDLEEMHLIVLDSKNGKQRLVPISESLTAVCRDYLNYRQTQYTSQRSDAFFIAPDGCPCNTDNAHRWFKRVLYNARIPYSGRGAGPRLHDLRHTFSVHSLAGMAENGTDLYYSLPILSAYLGHQSVTATDRYVRLTSDMFPAIIKQQSELHPNQLWDIKKKRHEAN